MHYDFFIGYETTLNGEKCIFPFKFNNHMFYGCTAINYHRPWCATDLNIHGLILSWDVCVADLSKSLIYSKTFPGFIISYF